MPLTNSQKLSILAYKKQILAFQLEISRLREKKKQRSSFYSNGIKNATTMSTKTAYRVNKLNEMNSLTSKIELAKKHIADLRVKINNIKQH